MVRTTRQTIELAPIAGRRGDPSRSRVVVEGRPTGTVVCGVALEAALAMDGGLLLMASYACPHEELLEVYLLDPGWRALDHLTLGVPYASGVLTDVRQVSGSEARFRFFGDGDAWTIRVGQPRWRFAPWAWTLGHLLGPVARPPARILSRSFLRIEGEYLGPRGRRVRVRG